MRRMASIRVLAIATIPLAALAIWVVPRAHNRELHLNACFQDVRGLRSGAVVRIAGVDVGRPTMVQAHPDRKDCLAEVAMKLSTPYQLDIPQDAIVRVQSAGLLGEEYVDIDVRQASGMPAIDRAFLKSASTPAPLDIVKAWMDAATSERKSGSKTEEHQPVGGK